MSSRQRIVGFSFRGFVIVATIVPLLGGCAAAKYRQHRRDGQAAMVNGTYGPALYFFREADKAKPGEAGNLHDMGACCVMLAGRNFERGNRTAAIRDLDSAVYYYSRAIEVNPGYQDAIVGKNTALEQKGEYDKALQHAEWAAKVVGPAARQYMFLASELEERGDIDGALLRYKQAVAMEPENFQAHIAFAKFLLKHNNEQAAVHHLQAAHRLDPNDGWVYEQLAIRNALPKKVAQAGG